MIGRTSLLAFGLALLAAPASAQAACPRPTDSGGYLGIAYDDAEVSTLDGPRVRVHFSVDGRHAVTDASAATVVRDVAEEAFDAFEEWGYPLPPGDVRRGCSGDGDDRYDIYLLDFAAADGQAVGETCEPTSGYANCSSFVRVARNLDQRYRSLEVGVRTVVVHELFHAVQYAMRTGVPGYFSEGTAQWAADRLHPSLTDLESYLPAFFREPHKPLDAQGNALAAWVYAAAIWPVFLEQRHGPEVILEILQNTDEDGDGVFAASDEVLRSRGSNLGDAFAEFGAWNVATGARARAGTGYTDAADYPEIELPVLDREQVQGALTSYSTNYFAWEPSARSLLQLLDHDPARLGGAVLPLATDGTALLDERRSLVDEPGEFEPGRYVVILSSRTDAKRDNPYVLRQSLAPQPAPPPAPTDAGGCSIQGNAMNRSSFASFVLLAFALVACRRSEKTETREAPSAEAGSVTRIVSVGAANTETVYALGKGAEVVAVDTSSLYPEAATKLPQVGYQRALSAEGVLSVKPTLVLLPPEGGPPNVVAQLRSSGLQIEVLDVPGTEQGTVQRIETIGKLLGVDAKPVVDKVQAEIAEASKHASALPGEPKVLVLYARGPGTVHAFGQKTPADHLLQLAHAKNAAQGFEGNQPITPEAIASWAPETIVLPARGLESLGGKDGVLNTPGLRETPAGKTGRIVPIDDVLLLGFGPRLGEAIRTLADAVHEPAP